MPDTVPIVGRLQRVTKPDEKSLDFMEPIDAQVPFLVVDVEGQKPARLDVHQKDGPALLEILGQLQPDNLPVYLECEDQGAFWEIRDVGVPEVVRVRALRSTETGDVVASLAPLSAPRLLRRSPNVEHFNESFNLLAESLREWSPLFATSVGASRILTHLAVAPNDLDLFQSKVSFESAKAKPIPLLTSDELRAKVTTVDGKRLGALLQKMHDMACNPTHVSRVCTPFVYVTDGCLARAHQMCEQLLKKEGVTAGKVWLRTSKGTRPMLSPETPNDPRCFADWEFHVAPVVLVQTPFGDEWRVIDPALYGRGEPVPTIEEWRARQRDVHAQFFFTEAGAYHKDLFFAGRDDVLDAAFNLAPKTLGTYRGLLIAQVKDEGRPPPYC